MTDETILKFVLQNSVKFNGKPNVGAIVGKIVSENPIWKDKIGELQKEIRNCMMDLEEKSVDEQKQMLLSLAPELLEKKKQEERDIFSFFGIAEGQKIITTFPPEPSKYMHIGHAKATVLNFLLAKQYDGKFVLRFDDTNPKLVKKPFYDIMLKDIEWLGISHESLEYASDHMEKFYELAEQLIVKGHAYMCLCELEKIRKNRFSGIPCEHRDHEPERNLKLWYEMTAAEEGSMLLRLKIDLKHQNTTMRDPAIFRIINQTHPRLGTTYVVWPTYDFETTIMDSLQGITHRLRSKEFELRSELQRYIQKLLGFPITRTYEFARFNLVGVESSGRIIREKIKNKELVGWDDPSLTTLVALKRRGFLPEAIKDFLLTTGITKTESTVTWDALYVANKKYVDKTANMYFFVENPVEITIHGAPERDVELHLHPEFPERGARKFRTHEKFYLAKKDVDELVDGELYRLMDCVNFRKENGKYIFDSIDYKHFKEKGKKIMHYLPQGLVTKVEVLLPDKTVCKGYGEMDLLHLPVGELCQLERFGFCKLDKKENNELFFWFTHK